jgi:hypothetical protein
MSLLDPMWAIAFNERELEIVRRPINGDGGDQRLLRKLGLGPTFIGPRLELEELDLQKCLRYAYGFATGGGYQDRFRAIVAAAKRAGWEQANEATR